MICNQEINTSLSAINVHFVVAVTTLRWYLDMFLSCIMFQPPDLKRMLM